MATSEVLPNGHSQSGVRSEGVLPNGHSHSASKWTPTVSGVLPNGHPQGASKWTPTVRHQIRRGASKWTLTSCLLFHTPPPTARRREGFRIRKGASKWPSQRCFQMDTVECLRMAASELLPNGLSLSDPIECFQVATHRVPPNGHPGLERLRPECFHLCTAACPA